MSFKSWVNNHLGWFSVIVVVVGGIIAVIVLAALGYFTSSNAAPSTTRTVIPDPTFDDCTTSQCFNVGNSCPFPIWINAVNNPLDPAVPVTLTPNNQKLNPGEKLQLAVPAVWTAGRVNAYYIDPVAYPGNSSFDKMEITVGAVAGQMNFDVTAVDYIALGTKITAGPGASCANNNNITGCPITLDDIAATCPSGSDYDLYDTSTGRCLSAGLYCSDPANQSKSICHLLDSTVAQCSDISNITLYPNCNNSANTVPPSNTTPNAYSCSGYFDAQPGQTPSHTDGNKWCAALNRGMLNNPLSTDTSLFYQGSAINPYAKWLHSICPYTYSFPYDDFNGQSGDRNCTTNRLDLLFCPSS